MKLVHQSPSWLLPTHFYALLVPPSSHLFPINNITKGENNVLVANAALGDKKGDPPKHKSKPQNTLLAINKILVGYLNKMQ